MPLNNFFQPLNLQNLLILSLAFLAWDVVGSWIAAKLDLPKVFRFTHWIIGLSVWVGTWFGLHFFVPFSAGLAWLTLLVPALVCIPAYVKSGAFKELALQVVKFPWPLLLIALLAKPLYFNTSLPPRNWDEMAYHLYSPARLATEQTWALMSPDNTHHYVPTFYDMQPRWLETSFVLLFVLSKTYALGQIVQVLLLITAIYTLAIFLKEQLGTVPAVVYAGLNVILFPGVWLAATTGYIDVGAAALALLFLTAAWSWLLNLKNCSSHSFWGTTYAVVIFSSIAASIKYTNLGFLVGVSGSMLFLSTLLNWPIISEQINVFKIRKNIFIALTKQVVSLFISGLAFGGYWYVKNLIVSGSPFYPFIGSGGESFILDPMWGYHRFVPQNFEVIVTQVFLGSYSLYSLALDSCGLLFLTAFWRRRFEVLLLPLLCLLGIVAEVLIVGQVGAFTLRFFYHWVLLVPFFLSLGVYVLSLLSKSAQNWQSNNKTANHQTLWQGLSLILLLAYTLTLAHQLKPFQQPLRDFQNLTEFNGNNHWFVRGKITLSEWLYPMFPHVYDMVSWCATQPTMTDVYTIDPTFIYGWDGMSKAYLINCRLLIPKIDPNNQDIVSQAAEFKAEHPQAKFISSFTCDQTTQALLDPKLEYPEFTTFNKEIICNAEQVVPQLYEVK